LGGVSSPYRHRIVTIGDRNIVLTGFEGTGKTTIGRLLADRLGFRWVDTDQLVESRHGPIPDVFARRGEAAFRALERAVSQELAGYGRLVVSTGGGLMLDSDNAVLLGAGDRVFCLVAEPDTILGRIGSGAARPLLEGFDAARVEELPAARAPLYARFRQVPTDGRSPAAIVDRILAELATGPGRQPSGSMFLVGRGISHSLSPAMWNHLFAGLAIDVDYGLRDVTAEDLPGVLAEVMSGSVVAANVTMPHKAWAAGAADVRTREVESTGAANLLQLRDGRLFAANTDVVGARRLLRHRGPFEAVTVLGAGGTAAAMLQSLIGVARSVVVVNRTAATAERLATAHAHGFDHIEAAPWTSRHQATARADLLVNTTPFVDEPPVDLERLPVAAHVYDVVYRSHPTALQRHALERGNPLCDGLTHLAAQAIAALGIVGIDPRHAPRLVRGLERAAHRRVMAWGHPMASAGHTEPLPGS
jgi:shikimate dehydrogenase